MLVRGYATVFDEPYELWRYSGTVFKEVIKRGAFDETDMSDVIFQYNHEGRVFARTSNNTLDLKQDDKGLLIEADLSGTEMGRQLYQEIRDGYTTKMSFGFTVGKTNRVREETEEGAEIYTREILSIRKLYDVSAVSIPANDATEISVRNLVDGEIEQIQAERLAAEALELRKRKMMMRLKLEGKK
jgi:HK97 family phage prohead protease